MHQLITRITYTVPVVLLALAKKAMLFFFQPQKASQVLSH
jgi:hypothetical protein